jgi:hypothetical protein
MDEDLITLAEAYRELIGARDPVLAAQAASLEKVRRLQDPGFEQDLAEEEWEAARERKKTSAKILSGCSEQLRGAIRGGKLPLRGYPATGVDQVDIGQTDREVGEIDFWKGTLIRDGRLIFTHLRCSTVDVRQLVIPPAPVPSSKGSRPSDKSLIIREGQKRLHAGQRADSLRAFAQELHHWLDIQPDARRAAKTGKVIRAHTIERHVRNIWNAHQEKN